MPARVPEDQPITKDEQGIIDAIKQQLAAKFQKSNNVSETTLLRFVRGFKDDANPKQKAIQMVSDMLDWRQRERVDEWGLTENSLPREQEFRSKFWQSGLHGRSKDGHPIYIEKLGSIDPSALTKNFSTDEVQKFHVQLMERITAYKEQLSEQTGHRIYKQVAILDLKGVGMGHTGSKFTTPMKSTIHVDQFYYPETLKLMFITNASWIIKTIWKLVSPWIDPITKENIKFGTAELANYIDKDQLPRFLGGTCKCKECLVTEFIPGDGAKLGAPSTPMSRRDSNSQNRQPVSAAAAAGSAATSVAPSQTTSPNHAQQQQQAPQQLQQQQVPQQTTPQTSSNGVVADSASPQHHHQQQESAVQQQQQQPIPADNQQRFTTTDQSLQNGAAQPEVVDGGFTVMKVPIQ